MIRFRSRLANVLYRLGQRVDPLASGIVRFVGDQHRSFLREID